MSDHSETIVETEWSYFFDAQGMPTGRVELSIEPNEEERRRLALRLGLLSLDALKADFVIQRRANDVAYHVKGRFSADLVQACVVTLEPVASHVDERFEAWFSDPKGPVSFAKLKHERETVKAHGEMPILEEKDDPEPLVAGKIDLGELVTQYLSLSIDPYPRAEGVEIGVPEAVKGGDEPDLVKNPFAALKDWKGRLKGDDA